MLSFFPRGVLDEIWDFIESVSEGFPTYSCFFCLACVYLSGKIYQRTFLEITENFVTAQTFLLSELPGKCQSHMP